MQQFENALFKYMILETLARVFMVLLGFGYVMNLVSIAFLIVSGSLANPEFLVYIALQIYGAIIWPLGSILGWISFVIWGFMV